MRTAILVTLLLSLSNPTLAQTADEKFGSGRKTHVPTRLSGGDLCPSGASKSPVDKSCECRIDDEDALYKDMVAEIEQPNTEPITALSVSPAVQAGSCGQSTYLKDTIASSVIRLRTTDGSVDFVPLFLSDKKRFYCVAIRPWTPCLEGSRTILDAQGRYLGAEVTLATEPHGLRQARVFIPANGDHRQIRSDDDNFVLLRRKSPYELTRGDTVNAVLSYAATQTCAAKDTPAACENKRRRAAERRALHILRIERKPSGASSEQADADYRQFETRVLGGMMSPAARMIGLAIMRNEIGYVPGSKKNTFSPYEVRDAGTASGLSFGHFQVDVATNNKGEAAPLKHALLQLAQRDPSDVALRSVADRDWLNFRVQSFSVDVLLVYFRAVPALYESMRVSPVRDEVDQQFVSYVDGRIGCLAKPARYGAPFDSDPVARLYVLDVANHFGKDQVPGLVNAALVAARSSAPPREAMLNYLFQTPYGLSEEHRTELRARQDAISRVVAAESPDAQVDTPQGACVVETIRPPSPILARAGLAWCQAIAWVAQFRKSWA